MLFAFAFARNTLTHFVIFTQESQPGRTFGESVGGIFEMDRSDWYWSNANANGIRIRYHIFDTRPDTEFNGPPLRSNIGAGGIAMYDHSSAAFTGRAVQVVPIKPTLKPPGTMSA